MSRPFDPYNMTRFIALGLVEITHENEVLLWHQVRDELKKQQAYHIIAYNTLWQVFPGDKKLLRYSAEWRRKHKRYRISHASDGSLQEACYAVIKHRDNRNGGSLP
jgi:hypothetical protein